MNLVSNFSNSAIDTPQAIITPTKDTVIDSFTVSNTSSVDASYKAYIIESAQSATNPQIPFKIVVWGENDLGIGVVNQVIPANGSLLVESSALNSLYFTVSGRELEE
jgi:hypothetical protein